MSINHNIHIEIIYLVLGKQKLLSTLIFLKNH